MRIKDILQAMASWLESSDNAAVLLSEYDDKCLEVVAKSCAEAAFILKQAAEEVDVLEPEEESILTEDAIEDLGSLASVLDASGDPNLIRQASVIDELLRTISAEKNIKEKLLAQNKETSEKNKEKFKSVNDELRKSNKISESEEAIKKSPVYDVYNVLEAPLSTRYCPDHAGVPVARVGEQVWQCSLDSKIYDFNAGFTLATGKKVPGSSVANQTPYVDINPEGLFSTRENYRR